MAAKRSRLDQAEQSVNIQVMDQFTPGNTASKVDLTQLENDISVIRNHLEKKTKKITPIVINAKIDKIIEMLKHDSLVHNNKCICLIQIWDNFVKTKTIYFVVYIN